jgi:WD40 repeat protein
MRLSHETNEHVLMPQASSSGCYLYAHQSSGYTDVLHADNCVHIWDVITGADTKVLRAKGQQGGLTYQVGSSEGINCIDWSPNGTHIAAAGGEKCIRIWNVDSGKEELLIDQFKASVNALSYSPGNTMSVYNP